VLFLWWDVSFRILLINAPKLIFVSNRFRTPHTASTKFHQAGTATVTATGSGSLEFIRLLSYVSYLRVVPVMTDCLCQYIYDYAQNSKQSSSS
jgi:hypothetical protein